MSACSVKAQAAAKKEVCGYSVRVQTRRDEDSVGSQRTAGAAGLHKMVKNERPTVAQYLNELLS